MQGEEVRYLLEVAWDFFTRVTALEDPETEDEWRQVEAEVMGKHFSKGDGSAQIYAIAQDLARAPVVEQAFREI